MESLVVTKLAEVSQLRAQGMMLVDIMHVVLSHGIQPLLDQVDLMWHLQRPG